MIMVDKNVKLFKKMVDKANVLLSEYEKIPCSNELVNYRVNWAMEGVCEVAYGSKSNSDDLFYECIRHKIVASDLYTQGIRKKDEDLIELANGLNRLSESLIDLIDLQLKFKYNPKTDKFKREHGAFYSFLKDYSTLQ